MSFENSGKNITVDTSNVIFHIFFLKLPAFISLEIFSVPLCAGEDDVDPDARCFARGRHEVVPPLPCFHYECCQGIRGLRRISVIQVHFFYYLEMEENVLKLILDSYFFNRWSDGTVGAVVQYSTAALRIVGSIFRICVCVCVCVCAFDMDVCMVSTVPRIHEKHLVVFF